MDETPVEIRRRGYVCVDAHRGRVNEEGQWWATPGVVPLTGTREWIRRGVRDVSHSVAPVSKDGKVQRIKTGDEGRGVPVVGCRPVVVEVLLIKLRWIDQRDVNGDPGRLGKSRRKFL